MKYFFILGKNPSLSLAEILATVKPKDFYLVTKDFLLLDSDVDILAKELINKMGGVIKIGKITEEVNKDAKDSAIVRNILRIALEKSKIFENKLKYGISEYGNQSINTKRLGLELKKKLKAEGVNSRFVVSKEKTLSSVVVGQNKLDTKGLELVLVKFKGDILLGETLAVQPYKSLSYRDFGRPARDDHSGMLPPKLAQIMINLAQVNNSDDLISDPFCGSGTILTEAMLMGYKNIIGSDSSFKAVSDTKENISWIKDKYDIKDVKMKFLVKDVLDLSKFIKTETVSAFITEPFLGPQRGKLDLDIIIKELEELYSKAIKEFYKVLKPGGTVVMVWPLFFSKYALNPDIYKFKMQSLIPDDFKKINFIKNELTERGNIIYGRAGQKVFREIIILKK